MKRNSLKKILLIVTVLSIFILSVAACATTTYTVSFNTGGGTAVAEQVIKSGEKASKPDSDPTREGYIFDNWYKDAAKTAVFDFDAEKIEADITVYAKFNAITYSVAYDKNAGTGTMINSSHTYDQAKTLSANTYTREGYTFAGWNTLADGSGASYAAGKSVNNLTATNGATVTLYAQWKLIEDDGLGGNYKGEGEWEGSENSPYWHFDIILDGLGNGTAVVEYSADRITWTSFLEDYIEGLVGPCPLTYTMEDDKLWISIDGQAQNAFDITVMENGNLYIIIYSIEAELVKDVSAPQS